MKYIVTRKPSRRSINLDNITDIVVSANYLVLTTPDGREEKFVYGAEKDLNELFDNLMDWLARDYECGVFDCDRAMEAIDYCRRNGID